MPIVFILADIDTWGCRAILLRVCRRDNADRQHTSCKHSDQDGVHFALPSDVESIFVKHLEGLELTPLLSNGSCWTSTALIAMIQINGSAVLIEVDQPRQRSNTA